MRFRSLVIFALAATCVLVFTSASQAARPERFHFTNSEFDPHFTTCDGAVISLFTTGKTFGSVFFDRDGDVTRIIVHNRFLDHFTNTATGEKLLNRGTFQETLIPVPGTRRKFTETIVGHVFLATQPHQGIVIHDSGRVVLSPDEDILFAAGHHDDLVEHQFEALLCSALT